MALQRSNARALQSHVELTYYKGSTLRATTAIDQWAWAWLYASLYIVGFCA